VREPTVNGYRRSSRACGVEAPCKVGSEETQGKDVHETVKLVRMPDVGRVGTRITNFDPC